MLNDANMDRIVSTLCRVRGAALKLGQMVSIQGKVLTYRATSHAIISYLRLSRGSWYHPLGSRPTLCNCVADSTLVVALLQITLCKYHVVDNTVFTVLQITLYYFVAY